MARTVKEALCEKWRAKLDATRGLFNSGAAVQIPIMPSELRLILTGQYPSQFADLRYKLDHSEPTHVLLRFAQLESLLSYAESTPEQPAVPADVPRHSETDLDDQADVGLAGLSSGDDTD